MGEYIGKINVSKDEMLFVLNEIFEQDIKESATKENILKKIPEIYKGDNLEKLIKILSYEAYKTLEKLMEFLKEHDDINEFVEQVEFEGILDLERAMIIVRRAKYSEYIYSLNPGSIENIMPIFSEENKELAIRYGEMENLIKGMLYTYGVVEFSFLRKSLCKYMNEIIAEDELQEILFERLSLNLLVSYQDIKWTPSNEVQSFLTYLNEELEGEEIVADIAEEQRSRGMKYKSFSKKEILKREQYLWDDNTQKLYEYIKSKNGDVWDFHIRRLVKENELGRDVLSKLSDFCKFETNEELNEFAEVFMKWYNNSPQYMLGGYSPVEFGRGNR